MRARPRSGPRAGLPFSRPLAVDDVPASGLDMTIEASRAECTAIAAAADLPSVSALTARFHVERRSGQRFELTGDLEAGITQICGVTLEPFEAKVEQEIELIFAEAPPPPAPERTSRRRGAAAEPVPAAQPIGEVDPPDPVLDGIIDLGEVAVEFLVLARDPYPRKPGAAFSEVVVGETAEPEPSAFAALQRLKDRP